jgi:hypothetical protein
MKLITYLGIMAMLATEAVAQNISLGYNALQVGLTNNKDARFRAYTNVALKASPVRLGFHGLNEGSNNYLFGRETAKLGLEGIAAADAIYTTRLAGNYPSNLEQIDRAAGARINIAGVSLIEYGWADIVKHFGNYKGPEAVIFAGKSVEGFNIEATAALKDGDKKYLEVEALTPSVDLGVKLRGYGRIELPGLKMENKSIVIGIQGQL